MRACLLIVAAVAVVAASSRVAPAPAADACLTASNKAYAYQRSRKPSTKKLVALERAALACASGRQTIAFWPQGGVLDHDLYLTNTVDLDSVVGRLRDPWCGARTYDGHTGQDVIIRSFREQARGVPVFSALDGRVIDVQTGAKDTSYGTQTLPWDNHVTVDSGRGQLAIYGHLRRGSIHVKVGDWVVAGQQIGLTASSGNSTWPHLHFTFVVDSEPVDPWSGPCNTRGWFVHQPALSTQPFARDFALSASAFTGRAALPWDETTRTGSFTQGVHDLWFRSMVLNAEHASVERLRILRPDGSAAVDRSHAPGWNTGRQATASWHERVDLDEPGTWRIQVALDGKQLLDQPFEVGGAGANRPPAAVQVTSERTAVGAWTCSVDTDLLHADPDYDLVAYRYVWRVGARTVRSIVAAGLQDVLPRTVVGTPSCTVTPTDGKLAGPSATG